MQNTGTVIESKECTPELKQLMELFNGQLARLGDNTISLNSGLQRIKYYEEPLLDNKPDNEKIVSSIIDILYDLHRRLEDYNSRLEFSCRHLNSMV